MSVGPNGISATTGKECTMGKVFGIAATLAILVIGIRLTLSSDEMSFYLSLIGF